MVCSVLIGLVRAAARTEIAPKIGGGVMKILSRVLVVFFGVAGAEFAVSSGSSQSVPPVENQLLSGAPELAAIVVVGQAGTVLRSTDAGGTWSNQYSGATDDLSAVSFADSRTGIVVGGNCRSVHCSRTIIRTTDGGDTWTVLFSGIVQALRGISLVDANTGVAVGGYCVAPESCSASVLRTTDGGSTWMESSLREDLLSKVFFVDAENGTAVGSRNIYPPVVQFQGTIVRTTDGGATWARPYLEPGPLFSGVTFVTADVGTVVGSDGAILKTTDSGWNWTPQSSGTTVALRGVSFVNTESGIVVGSDGTILRTIDGGESWTRQSSGTTRQLNAAAFIDTDVGFAVGNDGTILRTTDGGETWTTQPSGTTANLKSVAVARPNTGTTHADATLQFEAR